MVVVRDRKTIELNLRTSSSVPSWSQPGDRDCPADAALVDIAAPGRGCGRRVTIDTPNLETLDTCSSEMRFS